MAVYKVKDPLSSAEESALAKYSPFLAHLLHTRGLTTATEADEFLNPSYETHLHDPYLLPDMEKAVLRILSAVAKKERIAVWSDYDCDGIPGGALLHDFFKKIGADFLNYIPHRHEEGYGMNEKGVEELSAQGVTLIITVDCGITDHSPVARARELGVDTIVTDHHLPRKTGENADDLPGAFAVINPKRADSAYPFDGLCGGGLAFKLVQGILLRNRLGVNEGWEKWLLDMAGLSTLADMVPLRGENRAIAHFGLRVLRKSPRKGLQKLLAKARVKQRELTEDDVTFMIAPRINAASRMDAPHVAFEALTSTDDERGSAAAEHLHKINDQRKGVVAAVVKEVRGRLEIEGSVREVIVMGNSKWRPGLLGLVANILMEEYERPVFLWGREGLPAQAGGISLKGSCRSDGSVNVVKLMTEVKHLFVDFGGHTYSGGFSLSEEYAPSFEEEIMEAYRRLRNPSPAEEIFVDKKLTLSDVTWDTYRAVNSLAPFGEGNPKPTFLFERVVVSGVRRFGSDDAHFEMTFLKEDGGEVPAISFFVEREGFKIPLVGETINLIGSLERSTFGRAPTLRLRIVDVF